MLDRKRRIDLDKIDLNSITELTNKLTAKVTDITDEAVEKANKILNIYGMEAKMQIAIRKINIEQ